MSDTPADGAPSYRDIFEHLSAAIVVVDRDLRICDLNPAAETLLGRSRFRAAGLRLLDVTGDDGSIGPAIRQVFDDGASVAWETTLPERPGGPGEIRVECRMSPLDVALGQRLLLVEMIDITRRARINRENALLIQ
ncbi:MAG: PAS domain-containing protein, partial [Woeseiaceae bacterium]|nr:PAS domain-containing protein [Woeseiaceae bacterium]